MTELVKFDVFLSHNSQDKPLVEKIAAWLKEQHITVWYDEWELRPGIPWQNKLEQGILHSRAIVVCFGASGVGRWHEPEMRAALHESLKRGCPVIPVLLPGCPQNFDLPIFLQDRLWIDFRQDIENQKEKARLLWGITGQNPYNRDHKNDNPVQKPTSHSIVKKGELQRLQTRYQQLQHNHQMVCENIEASREDYDTETRTREKLQYKRKLDKEQAELEKIEEEMRTIESQIEALQ